MPNEFATLLRKMLDKHDLEEEEAGFALEEIMEGRVNNTQIAAFLTALKLKGETVEEVVAFARTMRRKAVPLHHKTSNLVDTAGTGGDGCATFNISTCAAIVAAGARVAVAKHGNRAVSGTSGSVDVLEELGVGIPASREAAEKQLEGIGITFLFAPIFHPAMKHIALVRKELGFKTIFNLLGPLTNPAHAERQLIGAYDKGALLKLAEAAKALGTKKTLVVSSDTDEISISSSTEICEVSGSNVRNYTISPEDFGFKRTSIDVIKAKDAAQSAGIILDVLKGRGGHVRDVVILNSGAAIYASGIAGSIKEGIRLAEVSIDTGKALEKLELLKNGHP